MTTTQQVAVISGGMGGIGRAIAKRLAEDGLRVAVLYHRSTAKDADTFVQTLLGQGHAAFSCDITDPEQTRHVLALVHASFGSVDVCVHAAVAPLVRAKAAVIDPQSFKEQFDVTMFGGLNFFQAVIPFLLEQKSGHIIGITTAALDTETPSGMAGYFCSKYALRGLLRELSLELPSTIRVDEITPGFVPTKLHADLPEVVRTFIVERTPVQTPESVADEVSRHIRA